MENIINEYNVEVSLGFTQDMSFHAARQKTLECVRPLFLGPQPSTLPNDSEGWDGNHLFGTMGTSHLLTYKGRYFQVFTRHQIFDKNSESHGNPYLMVSEDSDRILGTTGFSAFESNEEFGDIAVVEYENSAVKMYPELQESFFPIENMFYHPNADPEDKWQVVGYSEKHSEYNIDTGIPEFTKGFVEIFGEPLNSDRKQVKAICSLDIRKKTDGSFPLNGNYDGLSGSPVFAWSGKRQDIHYRGMVITGSNGTIRLIREGIIIQYLDMLIDKN